ncbi:MAG: NAD-dependent epimerase/dehydratase family protein [bacterium]
MIFSPDLEAPLLMTGATGFIGHHVARAFYRAGYSNLRLLARDPAGLAIISDVPHTVVKGDLRDETVVRKALDGVEGVVHLAADYRMWVRDPAELDAVNVDASRSLGQWSLDAGVARFCHCSSVAAIGRTSGAWPSDETVPWNLGWTRDAYTASKFRGEEEIKALFKSGLPGVIVNPSAPIGPGDIKPTPTGQMIVDFLNRQVPAWFDGGFDLVDVEDVAQGFLLVYEQGREHEQYILGGDNLTLKQIYGMASEISEIPAPSLRLPSWSVVPSATLMEWWARLTNTRPVLTTGGARMVMLPPWYDDTKARQELGYQTRPFRAAMERAIIDFYQRGLATPKPGSLMARLLRK